MVAFLRRAALSVVLVVVAWMAWTHHWVDHRQVQQGVGIFLILWFFLEEIGSDDRREH